MERNLIFTPIFEIMKQELDTKNDYLLNNIKQLSEENKQLKLQIFSIEKNNQVNMSENSIKIKQDMEKRDQLLQKARVSLKQLASENESLSQQVQILQSQLQVQQLPNQSDLAKLNQEIYRLSAQNTELQQKLEQQTQQNLKQLSSQQQSDLDIQLKLRTSAIEQNFNEQSARLTTQFNQQIERLQHDNFVLNQKLTSIQSLPQQFQMEQSNKQTENASLRIMNCNLTEEVNTLKNYRLDYLQLKHEYDQLFLNKQSLKEQNTSLQNQIQQLSNSSDIQYQELLNMQSAREGMEMQLADLRAQCEQKDVQAQNRMQECDQLKQNLNQVQLQLQETQRNLTDNLLNFNSVQEQAVNLQKQLEQVTFDCQQKQTVVNVFEQQNNELKQNDVQNRSQIEQLTADLREITQKFTVQEQMYKSLQEQNLKLQAHISDSEQMVSHQNSEIVRLRPELESAQKTVRKLETGRNELIIQQKMQTQELQNLRQLLDKSLEQIKTSTEEMQSLKEQLKQSQNSASQYSLMSSDAQSTLKQVQQTFNLQMNQKNDQLIKFQNLAVQFSAQVKQVARQVGELAQQFGIEFNEEEIRSSEDLMTLSQQYLFKIQQKYLDSLKEAQKISKGMQQQMGEYENCRLELENLKKQYNQQRDVLSNTEHNFELVKQDNENLIIQNQDKTKIIDQLQKQVVQSEDHKKNLKKFVDDCRQRIEVYEQAANNYTNILSQKETEITQETEQMRLKTKQRIAEFCQIVLQKLRVGDKEGVIQEVVQLAQEV